MSCDICGRGACAAWMHSFEEQERYSKVIEIFEHARELRDEIRNSDSEMEDVG